MKKILLGLFALFIAGKYYGQVGINNNHPTSTLQIEGISPATKVEGIIIPRFTGDQIFSMPIAATNTNEANMVYATSAATVANQTGRGENLKGKGFYYWDDTLKKWITVDQSTVTVNNVLSVIKPMNTMMTDGDTYPYGPVPPRIAFVAPGAPGLKLFDASFTGAGDTIILNNPLAGPPNNFVIWNDTTKVINVPQQLLGYAITINVSLKYPETTSNTESSRLVAFTGNAVFNLATGVNTGGHKIKDLMFKKTKTSGFDTVRDELVLSPIIVTQEIITYGIKLYLGSGDGSDVSFYEPILTIDYGVVNTSL